MNRRRKCYFHEMRAPFIAAIVQENTALATMANILNAEYAGAEGFMIDISYLRNEERTVESLHQIFAVSGRAMMPLVYRSGNMCRDQMSEDDRAAEMLKAMVAGAVSIDMMGDLFEPDAPFELACSASAISAQKDLICQIHEKGGEVLISSHMYEIRSAEQVLEHLLKQVERGADIAKIVCRCDSDADLLESVRTLILLKEKMDKPFIYLCNGRLGRVQRFIAPMLGCMLNFGIERFSPYSLGAQPTVAAAKRVLTEMTWHE